MALTQRDISLQMLAQLRMLDPSVSAEVGTPERKIIDTVAQALTDVQVDLTQLNGALDVDAKSGAELDRFLALFGFGRQIPATATGFVVFGRNEPSNLDISIPANTQIMAPNVVLSQSGDLSGNAVFRTLYATTLPAGQTQVTAAITAVTAGAAYNVATGQITDFGGSPIYGIHYLTNPTPLTGGVDAETDEALKVRFKNTVFRNLAGTQDQYLALAASTKFTTKANVVGPISRYQEYIQVPPEDDATAYDVDPGVVDAEAGNGNAGEYTAALSTIPFSKYTYTEVPNFVSNGEVAGNLVFWREGIDWEMNVASGAKNRGDAYRFWNTNATPKLGLSPLSDEAAYRPNVTFKNIYEGDNEDVTAIRPGEVVLFEHSYMSKASRNDWNRKVTNCVDVFIDGANDTVGATVLAAPGASLALALVDNAASKFHYANYRVVGEPDVAPGTWPSEVTDGPVALTPGGAFVPGTYLFMPLFFQPVTGLPPFITVTEGNFESMFFLGEHYWLVEDISELFGTVRARNGICWDRSKAGASSLTGSRTQRALMEFTDPSLSIEVSNYLYDRNVVDLQAMLETSKQVTTDVLVHRCRRRYFKFDITVMYDRGVNVQSVNAQIRDAINRYLARVYFGSVIQLADLLQAVHAVTGVDNVRWSSDIPGNDDLARAYETNATGTPRDGDEYVHSTDFFTMDDELPVLADAVNDDDATAMALRQLQALPGVNIRTRAQNTFTRA